MIRMLSAMFVVFCGFLAYASEVPVRVYADTDGSSLSDLTQEVGPGDVPLSGVKVKLLGGPQMQEGTTGPDGRVKLEGPVQGVRMLVPEMTPEAPCTSHNCSKRLAAILSGETNPALAYVALGDSTPVVGSDHPYPDRVADRLGQLFFVDLQNLAVPGTTTTDWMPGAPSFESARSAVMGADLITISLGGNDVGYAAMEGDIAKVLSAANEAMANLAVILEEIKSLNPFADIVVTIYPNYSMADNWLDYIPPDMVDLVRMGMHALLSEFRRSVAQVEGVVIADMLAVFDGYDINPFMYDPIHVNDLGHQAYADTIVRALGGVLLPQDSGKERLFSFNVLSLPDDEPELMSESGETIEGNEVSESGETLASPEGNEVSESGASEEGLLQVEDSAPIEPVLDVHEPEVLVEATFAEVPQEAVEIGASMDSLETSAQDATPAKHTTSGGGCTAATGPSWSLLVGFLALGLLPRRR